MTLYVVAMICVFGQPCDLEHARAYRQGQAEGVVCGVGQLAWLARSPLQPGPGEYLAIKCSLERPTKSPP